MKTKNLLSVLAVGIFVSTFGQNTPKLTFTASPGCISGGREVCLNNKQFR